jgi:UDP-N-acetylmuramoylalanine--D-glutamate ligase
MILPEIKSGMRALVFGNGASGKAADRLLKSRGVETLVLDGEDDIPQDSHFDFAVLSPGIPVSHRWCAECAEKGIPVAGELALGARFWRGRIVALTGSKGKSSVVRLIADTFNLAGLRATACGNYGLPFSDVAFEEHGEDDWAIVETSSFQMESVDKEDFHPELAGAVNFQEDHLDRHGNIETYHKCKLKLLESANLAFVPQGCVAMSGDGVLKACDMPGKVFEAEEVAEDFFAGTYFGNSILKRNAECAVALMRAAGLGDDAISAGLKAFRPLPHRMCTIGEKDGVKFIDDSKSTSLSSLAAAVRMAGEKGGIRLIAGGLPKGDNPKNAIKDLSESVKKVYLIGCCAEQFFEAWKNDVSCEICGTLDQAVDAVMRDVRGGETVLLSPGAASFDQFKSYGARGDMFASLVRARGVSVSADTEKRG